MDWETIITNDLKWGSGFCEGKKRIFEAYSKMNRADFVKFLYREYGIGGHTIERGIWQNHDAKGIEYSHREKDAKTALKWPDIAERIATLIDSDDYLTEKEKIKYGIAVNERWDGQILMVV